MVEAGMSPLMAIHCATQVAAETMGLANQVGTLTPGKWFDAVVVDGDPLADIKVLQEKRRILLVIKGGKVLIDRRGEWSEEEEEQRMKLPLGLSGGRA